MNSKPAASPSKTVLVTGGAGFIGSHLVERLLAEGDAVGVIDDFSTGSEENLKAVRNHPRLTVVRSKISECSALKAIVREAQFVFHLAAAVGVELVARSAVQVLDTNLRETELLLKAAAGEKVPVLLASTSEVYGRSEKPEFREDDDLVVGSPVRARWSYACSKLMNEFLALALARERGLKVVIARLFNVVGPRQVGCYGMVLPRFISAAQRGEPLRVYGDGRQTRCFCHVTEAIEAMIRLARHPAAPGGVFNIGSTEEVTIRDLAAEVIAALQSRSAIELVPYYQAYGPGFDDLRRRKPNLEKLIALVRFQPTMPLREIILRMTRAA